MTTVYPALAGKLSQTGSPPTGFSKFCAFWLRLHHIVITAMMLFVGNPNRLSAQTVYSVNVVGYVNQSLLPGKNLISVPLKPETNKVCFLFSPPYPNGSSIEKFYKTATSWTNNMFSVTAWDDPNMILNPGEAFFFNNPCSTNLIWTVVGEVMQGSLVNIIYTGTNFVASMIPIQGYLSLDLGFSADEGDYVSLWNATNQSYTTYSFDGWGWTPGEPYISVGQGFRVLSTRNKLWVKYFSVEGGGSAANIPPCILSSPVSQNVTSSQQATFKLDATGSFPLFFQWQLNNTNLIGATNYSLAISNVQDTDAGQYRVVITNAFGSATSAVASLTVSVITNAPPSVAINYPTNNSIFSAGTNLTISVNAMDIDGTISRVEFYMGNSILGSVTNGSFSPCSFVLSNIPPGTYVLSAQAFDNAGASNTSPGVVYTVNTVSTPPVFFFQTTTNSIRKDTGKVAVTVCKRGGSSAEVNFATVDGTARNIVDYDQNQGTLRFAAGDWNTNVLVSITPSSMYKGDKYFFVQLSLPSDGASVIEPSSSTITIVDTGAPTESFTRISPAPAASNTNGALCVYLSPPQANGKWRFAWESAWRDSGSVAGCLEAGNYEVVFKPVAGYQQPASALILILTNQPYVCTSYYTSIGVTSVGQFSVTILPTTVADRTEIDQRGQWRLIGEGWRNSNETVSNLLAGYYIVEFKDLPGLITPKRMQVYVAPNQNNIAEVTYLLDTSSFPGDPRTPVKLYFEDILNSYVNHYNYGYCGQLQSDAGAGSGFVVRERVVLTAAHMVFNDVTLSHVTGLRWFFQRYAGYYEPLPKSPRGWYLLEGYAAQRTNDANPGFSSPASQDLDAAALYFTEPAGRGGCGGYLVSQTNSTEWLMTVSNKMLVGYPIRGINSVDVGKMHATAPYNLSFEALTNHVFTSTSFRSYPGNSGGPLCVLHTNGYYYPAGIYLGGTDRSVVRAIDSSVAKLIASADLSSYDDQNHTGGGTIKIMNPSGSGWNPGFVQVILGPPLALARGGAWRVSSNYPAYASYFTYMTNQYKISVQNGAFDIEFKDVPGFRSPTGQAVQVTGGQTAQILANYLVIPPTMKLLSSSLTNLMIWGTNGTEGTVYRIEYATNLNQSSNWLLHTNITLGPGTNSVQLLMPTNYRNLFYRALWMP